MRMQLVSTAWLPHSKAQINTHALGHSPIYMYICIERERDIDTCTHTYTSTLTLTGAIAAHLQVSNLHYTSLTRKLKTI